MNSFLRHGLGCAAALAIAGGCATPNKANITLRKQIAQQDQEIRSLKTTNEALRAQIDGLDSAHARGTATLPTDKLAQLFTAHAVEIHRLSTGADLRREGKDDTGIRLYVYPTDEAGNPIQATGHFKIDAYDLSAGQKAHIGHWEFTPEDCKKSWFGGLLRYSYVFELPFAQPPPGDHLMLHVEFTDELTNRLFRATREVKIRRAPATTQP